jgi:hypothetical protein
MEFEGETVEEVGEAGGQHVMSSTDEAHAPMKKQMAESSEEDKKKWWDGFRAQWDQKN